MLNADRLIVNFFKDKHRNSFLKKIKIEEKDNFEPQRKRRRIEVEEIGRQEEDLEEKVNVIKNFSLMPGGDGLQVEDFQFQVNTRN